MATKTDQRKLRVKIFQLVELNTTNYSTFIEINPIDSIEPNAMNDFQVSQILSSGYTPYNAQIVEVQRDPYVDQAVKEKYDQLAKVTTPDDAAATMGVAFERSRIVNCLPSKQLLLRNRIDSSNEVYSDQIVDYNPSTRINTQTEMKFIYNYRQIFSESGADYSTTIHVNIPVGGAIGRILKQLAQGLTGAVSRLDIRMQTNGNLLAEYIDLNTGVNPFDDEIDFYNSVTSYLQEVMNYNNAQLLAYQDKLEINNDQRTISFSMPFTSINLLNLISTRDTSDQDFGFVIYDEADESDIFETNNLGQQILTSDNTKIVDWGYINNIKTVGGSYTFSGIRNILPSSPTVFNKRKAASAITETIFKTTTNHDTSEFPTGTPPDNYVVSVSGGPPPLLGIGFSVAVFGDPEDEQDKQIIFTPFAAAANDNYLITIRYRFEISNKSTSSARDIFLKIRNSGTDVISYKYLEGENTTASFVVNKTAAFEFSTVFVEQDEIAAFSLTIFDFSMERLES